MAQIVDAYGRITEVVGRRGRQARPTEPVTGTVISLDPFTVRVDATGQILHPFLVGSGA